MSVSSEQWYLIVRFQRSMTKVSPQNGADNTTKWYFLSTKGIE